MYVNVWVWRHEHEEEKHFTPDCLVRSHSVCLSSLSASPSRPISEKMPYGYNISTFTHKARWKIRNQVGSRCRITQRTGAAEEYLSFRCCVTSQTHTLLNHRSACRSIFSSFPSSSTTKPPSCSSSSSSSWLVNFTLKTTEMNRELEALLERLGFLSGKKNK